MKKVMIVVMVLLMARIFYVTATGAPITPEQGELCQIGAAAVYVETRGLPSSVVTFEDGSSYLVENRHIKCE